MVSLHWGREQTAGKEVPMMMYSSMAKPGLGYKSMETNNFALLIFKAKLIRCIHFYM